MHVTVCALNLLFRAKEMSECVLRNVVLLNYGIKITNTNVCVKQNHFG